MDERLDLCYRALMIRHNTLKGTKSDVAPILWQHGAFARLKPGEVIDDLLYNNYSTISLIVLFIVLLSSDIVSICSFNLSIWFSTV